MTDLDQQLEHQIRAEERAATASRIAVELTKKVCTDICEHPACASYRFAARTARRHGTTPPHVPTQVARP